MKKRMLEFDMLVIMEDKRQNINIKLSYFLNNQPIPQDILDFRINILLVNYRINMKCMY